MPSPQQKARHNCWNTLFFLLELKFYFGQVMQSRCLLVKKSLQSVQRWFGSLSCCKHKYSPTQNKDLVLHALSWDPYYGDSMSFIKTCQLGANLQFWLIKLKLFAFLGPSSYNCPVHPRRWFLCGNSTMKAWFLQLPLNTLRLDVPAN